MNYKMILGMATALGLVQAAPAFAQAAPEAAAPAKAAPRADDDGALTDIIVTARRTEERLQDVPISITVFNQQQITNRNIVNAGDLATYTPSLSSNGNFGTENTSFAIRGFVQDPGTAPSVGVYFADVVALRGPTQGTQAGDGAGPGSVFDLQNVQVLKGPQGTLQGRNTTGGAVLFVPQKPTGKLEGYLEGSYGNYNMHRVQGAINIPLSDTARFRLSGDYMSRDGYLKNISGVGVKDFNDVNYFALRGSLVVDLTPDLENYSIVSYSKSDTHGSVQKTIAADCNPADFLGFLACQQLAKEKAAGAGFYDVEAALSEGSYSQLEQWQVINTTTFHASDTLTLKNIVSYGQLTDKQLSPLFGNAWNLNFPPFNLATPFFLTEIAPVPGGYNADQSTFTEEFQLQGSGLGDKLKYQAGAYLEVSNPLGASGNLSQQLTLCQDRATLTGCFSPLGAGSVNYTVGRTSYRDVGLYAQATYSLTDKLKLTGGFRYTWDRASNTSTRITNTFPVPGGAAVPFCTDNTLTYPNCTGSVSQQSSKPTWLIDLDYKPTDDLLIYAKYSRGYRAGGVFPNAPSNYRTFGPEQVEAYEGGIKATFRGAIHGTFNVSGFYNDFSNQQLAVPFLSANPNVSQTTGVVNAGASRIYGAEVDASITLFHGFTVDGDYTYLNTRINKIDALVSNDPNYVISNQIPVGDELTLSPKNKYSVTATYTLPLDESIGRISIGGTFTHSDSQLSTYAYEGGTPYAANLGGDYGRLKPRNLVNINLNWNGIAGSPIDVAGFVSNLTNQKYYAYVPGLAGAGFETASLGEPRFYGVRVRYTFGR